jgi:hypothetical protein
VAKSDKDFSLMGVTAVGKDLKRAQTVACAA